MLADRVENYPGVVEGGTGPDLADGMEEQAHRHCLGTDRCSSGERNASFLVSPTTLQSYTYPGRPG